MNPPSLSFLNLLDVTAIARHARAFLFNEAAKVYFPAGVDRRAEGRSLFTAERCNSAPASPIARGLGKDAHACRVVPHTRNFPASFSLLGFMPPFLRQIGVTTQYNLTPSDWQ